MATTTVQMDYDVVGQGSKKFGQVAEALRAVAKGLEIAINILRASAFLSGGTSLALARYLENIKNKIMPLAKLCDEFSGDLARAIQDHKSGDIQGKRYFGEGVA